MENTGYKGWKILENYYLDDLSLAGMIMPNIQQISPQAIVPSTATITFNVATDVAPTGGVDGDIWYNLPADILYKKLSGTWTALIDRVTNIYYVAPVYNLDSCPLLEE